MLQDFDGWIVKDQRCECCAGQGALVFVSCVVCEHLSIVCDEVGTTYLDPHDLESAKYGGTSDELMCPACKGDYCNFVAASAIQIKEAGFPDDYAIFQKGIPDPR